MVPRVNVQPDVKLFLLLGKHCQLEDRPYIVQHVPYIIVIIKEDVASIFEDFNTFINSHD